VSSSLCKKERGYLLAFRIVVKEDRIENSFHTTSVTKDPHRSGSSFDFHKSSFDKVRGANPSPQGLLSFLKFLGTSTLSLLRRKFNLVKRKQIVDL
jgi:hypothetical protein